MDGWGWFGGVVVWQSNTQHGNPSSINVLLIGKYAEIKNTIKLRARPASDARDKYCVDSQA